MPYLQDADFTLYQGDALGTLRTLPDESVHCVVTSPPYWGLRDYGTGEWEGGDPDCDHKRPGPAPTSTASIPQPGYKVGFRHGEGDTDHANEPYREVCGKCGARRIDQQLGLELTPDAYVANMVELFREVRRVLRRDGTCFLNLGDSYCSAPGQRVKREGGRTDTIGWKQDTNVGSLAQGASYDPTLKPKDLIGIPWRVAFALQADGWYLRSDIIWSKPNPMPESVTDRPTKAHEYLFLLTRSPRYFFDQDAIREDATWDRWSSKQTTPKHTANGNDRYSSFGRDWTEEELERYRSGGRNARSVWEIATQPFSARALFGDSERIPSRDCPVHGDRPAPAPTAPHDGREDAPSPHTPRTDARPAQEPPVELVPTEPSLEPDSAPASSDSPPRACNETATPSSKRTRKTSSRSDERDTPAAQTPGRTPDSEPSDGTLALDGFDSHDSSETDGHISRTSGLTGGSYSPPGQAPHGNARGEKATCTCKYIDHFATFPEELARRCIAAGTSERGCCPVCGAPWERETDVSYEPIRKSRIQDQPKQRAREGAELDAEKPFGFTQYAVANKDVKTTGWRPGCSHEQLRPIPCTTLDPFMGSGTVAHVARKLGRRSIGIELNPDYCELAARRLQQQSLLA